MKIYKKMILILFLIIAILFTFTSVAFADIIDTSIYNPGEVEGVGTGEIRTMAGEVLAIIRNVGIIASVIILSIIGLKYMFGSLDEKANYKENMMPYIIGCFLLAGATIIPSLIYDILN